MELGKRTFIHHRLRCICRVEAAAHQIRYKDQTDLQTNPTRGSRNRFLIDLPARSRNIGASSTVRNSEYSARRSTTPQVLQE